MWKMSKYAHAVNHLSRGYSANQQTASHTQGILPTPIANNGVNPSTICDQTSGTDLNSNATVTTTTYNPQAQKGEANMIQRTTLASNHSFSCTNFYRQSSPYHATNTPLVNNNPNNNSNSLRLHRSATHPPPGISRSNTGAFQVCVISFNEQNLGHWPN